FTLLNLTFGYDDNIVDPAATAASNAGDNYLSLFLVASQKLDSDSKNGWSVKGSFYQTDYFSVSAYDMTSIKGGITRAIDNQDWPLRLSLDYSQTTLGGASYLSKTTLTVKSRNHKLNSGTLDLRLRFNSINASSVYNYLGGSQIQLRVENRWRGEQQKQLRIGYDYEQNSRNDKQAPFVSYSPTRHTFSLRGRSELNRAWLGRARLSYRISQYPADSNPQRRKDMTTTVGFSAERRLWKNWDFTAGLKHTDNSSNIAASSYSRNELSLQLSRLF
ncbi:MAG: outer membrane beta-barrel protein, partial [Gammaproteobacteria bacterium]|nr:outer membrane beta-barrel protein [Gammaproteobacteria bacterium]